MGAFLVLYPRVRVRTLFFIFFIFFLEVPAALVLLYWFVVQLFSGFMSAHSFSDSGGVAWFAHVGGFLAGLFLIRLFPNTRRYFY
jgi:membrane associated rhomboid family serine protease